MSRERNLLSCLVDEAADTELQRCHAEAQAHLQDYDANKALMGKFVIPAELKRVAGILARGAAAAGVPGAVVRRREEASDRRGVH